MSYPMGLDEYSDVRIREEWTRRRQALLEHKCFYCDKALDSGKPCKLNKHRTERANPGQLALVEAALRPIADHIEKNMPPGYWFVLCVGAFGEDAYASYIANITRDTASSVMREMADHIEKGKG